MPNRTCCDVLEEMRKCLKTMNFSYLEGLIEEAQTMANRMESALWDQADYRHKMKELKEAKEEIKELEAKKELLEKEIK